MNELAHLRVYRFEPGAVFEGGLLAAVERMEIGHDAKLLDALFVGRDAESGAWDAVDLAIGRADATFASLLDFRLDSARRQSITRRTLAEHPGGVPESLIEKIAATVSAGGAVLAILYAGEVSILDDAAARGGGRVIADEPVDARELAQADRELRAAVGGG